MSALQSLDLQAFNLKFWPGILTASLGILTTAPRILTHFYYKYRSSTSMPPEVVGLLALPSEIEESVKKHIVPLIAEETVVHWIQFYSWRNVLARFSVPVARKGNPHNHVPRLHTKCMRLVDVHLKP